eukprot:COSAG01_NODE_1102_length_11682_cov_11.201848_6_plen_180_part_00
MNSIMLVKSRTKTLVPGEVSFGSWLPWELSSITAQVERYEIEDKHLIAGSRFHQPTAFWFEHLGLDSADKVVNRGMPVDSYTMPVYFGYGIVRLLRAAARANQTKMFSTPIVKLAIEFMCECDHAIPSAAVRIVLSLNRSVIMRRAQIRKGRVCKAICVLHFQHARLDGFHRDDCQSGQ